LSGHSEGRDGKDQVSRPATQKKKKMLAKETPYLNEKAGAVVHVRHYCYAET
jgi:hypothetical protein